MKKKKTIIISITVCENFAANSSIISWKSTFRYSYGLQEARVSIILRGFVYKRTHAHLTCALIRLISIVFQQLNIFY